MSRLARPKTGSDGQAITKQKPKWGRVIISGLVVVLTIGGLVHIVKKQKVYT